MNTNKPLLLVEDDTVDQMTVQRAMTDIHITNRLTIAKSGEEALDFLRNPDTEHPGLIILDINMPRMNGIEFLQTIKNDDTLRMIPVVILTTSREARDKIRCFDLGVAGYMIKPVDYDQFVEMVKTIDSYWTLCEFPE